MSALNYFIPFQFIVTINKFFCFFYPVTHTSVSKRTSIPPCRIFTIIPDYIPYVFMTFCTTSKKFKTSSIYLLVCYITIAYMKILSYHIDNLIQSKMFFGLNTGFKIISIYSFIQIITLSNISNIIYLLMGEYKILYLTWF